jgi:hypothetical protein
MSQLKAFELLEGLEPDGSARARLLVWNGMNYVAAGEIITIYDVVGAHGPVGDRGFGVLSEDSKRWEVVSGLFEQRHRSIV